MKAIWQKIISSFENNKEGFSGRKLSAFFCFIVAFYISVYQVPSEYKLECVYAWLAVALLCLGIVTVQNILEFKNGKPTEPTQQV